MCGAFTTSTGRNADVVVAVEPPYSSAVPSANVRDREPVEDVPCCALRDLARPVQVHEAGREHLASGCRSRRRRVRRAARRWSTGSRRCRSAACTRRARTWPRARRWPARRRWRRVFERERRPVADHEHVDLVDVHAVRVLGSDAERARQVRVRFDDQQPVRIRGRALHLGARSRPRAARGSSSPSASGSAAVVATTRGANCSAIVTNRRKSAGTNSMSRAAVDQDPLGGPEEAADIAHARLGEQRVEVEEQRAEHVEVFPVVAFTERVQQRRRLTRPQRDPEGVTRPEQCGGFRRRALLHDL